MKIEEFVRNVPDFPQPGIQFKDITPLLASPEAFKETITKICAFAKEKKATKIVGPDARGFIFGTPVAYELGLGFVPVRKPGKLPCDTISVSYDLEYGSNTLAIHKDAIQKGDKVLIIDDLLATGGTISATIKLVEELGGEVVGAAFVIELVDLGGRDNVKVPVYSLIKY